jgi:hypothetical protein
LSYVAGAMTAALHERSETHHEPSMRGGHDGFRKG